VRDVSATADEGDDEEDKDAAAAVAEDGDDDADDRSCCCCCDERESVMGTVALELEEDEREADDGACTLMLRVLFDGTDSLGLPLTAVDGPRDRCAATEVDAALDEGKTLDAVEVRGVRNKSLSSTEGEGGEPSSLS
jgi:hypothetical protein